MGREKGEREGYCVNPLYFPNFVEDIRNARMTKKLTYREVQKATGVSHSYINQMENRKFLPSADKCLKVAYYLGLDVEKVVNELYDYWLHSLNDEFGEYCKLYKIEPPFKQK